MERVEVCDGWAVEFAAPVLRIVEGETAVFEADSFRPSPLAPDGLRDALGWASAIADPGSGLTVDEDDDPAFAKGVRYVRENAPAIFADECALLSEDADR